MDSSAARRLQIARGLATLLRREKITQQQLAERSGFSAGTVSRYLDWRTTAKLKPTTVRGLAQAAGGMPAEVETLTRLANGGAEGWWVGHAAVPPWLNPLFSLETEATGEAIFAPSAVPGLLQTREYAEAQHYAQEVRVDSDVVDAAVEARIKRQAILDRNPPFHIWCVLDEAVLRRVVGDRDVMARQIAHLHDLASRPNIDVQVLPFTAGAYSAVNGQFLLLELGGAHDEPDSHDRLDSPDVSVVYIEGRGGGTYLDQAPDVDPYRVAWDYVRSQAADTTTSLAMLAAAIEEYRT
jgi:transcriptional regulator with XRE-family HTH domain